MKKKMKVMTMAASWMLVIGIILAIIGISAGAKFGITNTKDGFKVLGLEDQIIEELPLPAFTKITSNLNDVDIEIIPSNEYRLKIERQKEIEISHKVENDTLVIEESKRNVPLLFINLTFTSIPDNAIKIYVPKEVIFSEILLNNQFGDVRLEGVNSNKINIDSNDGDLIFNDVQANNFKIVNQYGDINGRNVTTKELVIVLNDADAEFDKLNAASTVLNNQFGDITFRNFSSEGLNIQSNDGEIAIHGLLLGASTIHSNFGDVQVHLLNKEFEISYSIQNNFGDITVNNNDYETHATYTVNSGHELNITANDGDVEVTF
ncbi:DUF4097 family beta strand repeat-containing protein [Bacillus sp. FJAT-29937]|uniref:DUF4097 family beta strand repeat-containing protein n=1 Tax=Bacillus sp. FJAT-29937 TaxID=1720553 RepID=UPI00083630E4|nr:DUF4097 family beta strand repeat-containing protein [Bacillus sp. FJAT-29937]